jgi:hypothetical protein
VDDDIEQEDFDTTYALGELVQGLADENYPMPPRDQLIKPQRALIKALWRIQDVFQSDEDDEEYTLAQLFEIAMMAESETDE